MRPLRVGVIGSRDVCNKSVVFSILKEHLNFGDVRVGVVHSGGARGVDSITRVYCKENEIPHVMWKPYFMLNKQAKFTQEDFHIRDMQIIDNSDIVLIIYDGHSSDTRVAYDYAVRKQKQITEVIV